MNGGQLLTNQLHVHDINWGALDHASCAPHVTTLWVCIYMRERERGGSMAVDIQSNIYILSLSNMLN